MGYYGPGNTGSLYDDDGDTGIQVEETTDDDVIRFDLGGATPIGDALTLSQSSGFVWNAASDDLGFTVGTTGEPQAFFVNAGDDEAVFNVPLSVVNDGASSFKILNSSNDSHFDVTTGDIGAGGLGSVGVNMKPNGGEPMTAGSQIIIGVNVNSDLGGSGVQSPNYWGVNATIKVTDSVVKGALGDYRGMMAETVWASTGDCLAAMVGHQTSSFVGGGSGVAAGTVSTQIANRVQFGYFTASGAGDLAAPASGAITNGYGILVSSPQGTAGGKTITNAYGINIADMGQTGVTNAYAIRTGTGLVEFGDQTLVNASSGPGTFSVNGSLGRGVTALNAATLTLDDSHYIVAVTYTTTGTVTITLPSASSAWDSTNNIGRSYVIKDAGANAATNNITINRAGSDTITDTATGSTSTTLISDGASVNITAINSSTWIIH